MSTRSIRFPASLDERLRLAAAHDGVSVNQYVALAVAERLAGESTLEALKKRAARGSREKFLAVLDAVPDVPPMPGDEMPDGGRVRERRAPGYKPRRHR